MKKIIIGLLVLGSLAFAGGASKPVSKGPTGTISDPAGVLAYGGYVTFHETWQGVQGSAVVNTVVLCFQDVDGDGVIDHGRKDGNYYEDMVFGTLDGEGDATPRNEDSFDITIGLAQVGSWSLWVERDGGSAECDATLYEYGSQAGHQTITQLAPTVHFTAAG